MRPIKIMQDTLYTSLESRPFPAPTLGGAAERKTAGSTSHVSGV